MSFSEESYKLIEGDWKDFRFRRILPADYEAVFHHVAHNYFKDEPTSNLLGWSQQFADDMSKVVGRILDDGLSFMAEHIPSGKVAGVRITVNHKPTTSFADIPIESRSGRLFLKYVNDIEGMAEVEKTCGIDTWAEFYIASTDREFRNQGPHSQPLISDYYPYPIHIQSISVFTT